MYFPPIVLHDHDTQIAAGITNSRAFEAYSNIDWSVNLVHTEILLNQPEIRLYLPFSD